MTVFPIGRPRFVSAEEAIGWHEMALAQDGGLAGIRDITLLESALAMPRQGFSGEYAHAYPFEMAAAYAFHVAKNHPFADGNKRAALVCCGSFLRMNGWDLVSTGTEAADAILDLLSGRLDKQGLAEWLHKHCKPRASLELRDLFAMLDAPALNKWLASATQGSPQELVASEAEAGRAIPALAVLGRAHDEAVQRGELTAAVHLVGALATLTCIFRMAEDMGYEW